MHYALRTTHYALRSSHPASRILLLLLLHAILSTNQPAAHAFAGNDSVHDPSMIKAGDSYYVFSTGEENGFNHGNIQVRRSSDLKNWTLIGTVFTTTPDWIKTALGKTPPNLWAPDINVFNGKFYLYYAGSSFGSNNSVIGLATATKIEGPWTDEGEVFRSTKANNYNAIDPDITWTITDGQRAEQWLVFGSFWDGIKMRQLDPKTGKLSTKDTMLYSLASRGGGAIEAASVVWHDGYYYLFVSFDACCRGVTSTYRTMVGRATKITGPYVDKKGVPMMLGGGTQLLASAGPYIGQGGGDVLVDGSIYRLAHHYYDGNANGRPRLAVRNLMWSSDNWPIVGPVLPYP